jgi:hypothetical protein
VTWSRGQSPHRASGWIGCGIRSVSTCSRRLPNRDGELIFLKNRRLVGPRRCGYAASAAFFSVDACSLEARWTSRVRRRSDSEGRTRRAFRTSDGTTHHGGPSASPARECRLARAGRRGVPEPGTAPRAATGTPCGARPTRDDHTLSDPRRRHLAGAGPTVLMVASRGGASRGLATRKPTLLFSFVGSLLFRLDAARLSGLLLKFPPRRPRFEPLVLLVSRLRRPGTRPTTYRRPSTARRRSLLFACRAWATHDCTLDVSASASAPWCSTSQRRRR